MMLVLTGRAVAPGLCLESALAPYLVPGTKRSPDLKSRCAGVSEIRAAGFWLSLQGKGGLVVFICQEKKMSCLLRG